MEQADSELKPFNVTADIEKQLTFLQRRVDEAFENRVPVSLTAILKRGDLEQPHETGNNVSIKNIHLYPHLLRMAYQKIGMQGEELRKAVERTFKHEAQHFVPIAGSPHAFIRFEVRFYKVARFPFISVCQAAVIHPGRITIAEELDVITNVSHLSPSDKANLKQVLQQLRDARKFRQSTS